MTVLSVVVGYAVGFQSLHPTSLTSQQHYKHEPPTRTTTTTLAMSSYLDSLRPQPLFASNAKPKQKSYAISNYSPPASTPDSPPPPPQQQQQQYQAPSIASPPSPPAAAAAVDASSIGFAHATKEFFGLDQLQSKGPRPTFDWGEPGDATRQLADDGMLCSGSWWCSRGGWPSPNPKAATEIFYMLDGHGCLGDEDGMLHYFGPGDTVIIPKGHKGRWDVNQDIHKIWAVNAHDRIEEAGPIVRVQVNGYHTFAPQYLTPLNVGDIDPLYGIPISSASSSSVATSTFYNVGPTQVGVWTSTSPHSFCVSGNSLRAFFHLLEGVVVVTDGSSSGQARRCVPGDTVMFPKGWHGHIDVIEPAKKLWTTAQ